MFAQMPGGSGYPLLANASAVVLLAGVLYWLFYVHLPAKDRQVVDLLELLQKKEKDGPASNPADRPTF